MSVTQFLQDVAQVLFIVIFLVVAARAARAPRRATVDTALLFGVCALIVAQGWLTAVLALRPSPLFTEGMGTLLMALPYLLLRLVDDFSQVPRPVLRGAAVGFGGAAIGLFVLGPTLPVPLDLVYVVYFVALMIYEAAAFARGAGRSNGVTRRRLLAVAAGSIMLGLDIVVAGVAAVFPAHTAWWGALSGFTGVGCGLAYFIGFAPPVWLRRAWQEPELRAFLARAALLPRLPDTPAILRALEHGAATSLGAPRAAILLWDADTQMLQHDLLGGRAPRPPGDELIGDRAFTLQRSLFVADAARADPTHADLYRQHGVIAVLAVPITAGTKRLGVLLVLASHPSIFAEDDLTLAHLLANQAAVILESRALIDEAAGVRAREEAARLKDDFLSAAAHDLKTPLTALITQAQLMERRAMRRPEAPADLAGIQRMLAEAQRLKRLVLDLLDGARVEQDRLVGPRETVDLVAVAAEACTRQSSSHHRCLLDAPAPVSGMYDRPRIMQLVDNLLENAVKYSPAGGEVRVRLWSEAGAARLTVTDQGIGIPAADLPLLFERFHRGSNVDDRRFAGMGLGLYICRGIVKQHGGRLWATSPGAGQGSTFHIALPLEAARPETAAARPGDGEARARSDAQPLQEERRVG